MQKFKKKLGNLFDNISYRIQHLEKEGLEVKPVLFSYRSKKARHFFTVNPIDKLKQKGVISDSEYIAAKQYQYDFELSNITLHARMNYDSVLTSGGKMAIRELKEENIKANENVFIIKKLLSEKEGAYRKFCKARASRNRDIGYLKILELLFERQMRLSNVKMALGFHKYTKDNIESRIKKVVEILDNYYNN